MTCDCVRVYVYVTLTAHACARVCVRVFGCVRMCVYHMNGFVCVCLRQMGMCMRVRASSGGFNPLISHPPVRRAVVFPGQYPRVAETPTIERFPYAGAVPVGIPPC